MSDECMILGNTPIHLAVMMISLCVGFILPIQMAGSLKYYLGCCTLKYALAAK